MTSHSYNTKYCAKDVVVEYEVEPGEDNFNFPGHICDGGGSGPLVMITTVYSEQGNMLYTQRQYEKWEEAIANAVCSDPRFFDFFDEDNYM